MKNMPKGEKHWRWQGGNPKCKECGKILPFRVIKSLKGKTRCKECNYKFNTGENHPNYKGPIICQDCGKKLEGRNKRKRCQKCHIKFFIPWNKGKSKFKTVEGYKTYYNNCRKIRRKNQLQKEKIADIVRTRIRNSIKYIIKNDSQERKKRAGTTILIGCSIKEFIRYLEFNFREGMSWDNYGNKNNQWNIDHIKPISSFNLTELNEQKKAFHYSNCRPYWAKDNFKKGAKI